jgi:hypothetical protein
MKIFLTFKIKIAYSNNKSHEDQEDINSKIID